MAVEWLTSVYAAQQHEVSVANAILSGEYAWIFWTSAALLVVSFLLLLGQVVSKRFSLPLIVLTGVLVNLAAIGKRYLIVVPSQTHGTLLPYGPGSYNPSWVELSVIAGIIGLGALLYLLFTKVFPIMEVPEQSEGGR
jgi:molybdopterin-containing oxidoreductase family membrane subunit